MKRVSWLLCLGLLAGCQSPSLPSAPVVAQAAPPPPPVATPAPRTPLEQAQELFEQGQYAEAAALAGQLTGREAEELRATALLSCGRELQALAAYTELARQYPDHPEYARIHRGLHNGFVLNRADNYLNRAALALNRGYRRQASALIQQALDALYTQIGPPNPERLKLARELLALSTPRPRPAPPPPAPARLHVLAPRPAAVPVPSYPKAGPVTVRPRPRPRPVAVPLPPPVLEPPVAARPAPPAPYYRREPQSSLVAQKRAQESLLHHRGPSMVPFQGWGVMGGPSY